MEKTEVKVDQDILEMLGDIGDNATPRQLVIFNDDHTPMDVVIMAIIIAYKVIGEECDVPRANQIMATAHHTGRSIVYRGTLENCNKMLPVFKKVKIKAEVQQ